MNLQGLTRGVSFYLESRVREGLLASGVGWSLVLCFGAAYACYYLSSIAKVGGLLASLGKRGRPRPMEEGGAGSGKGQPRSAPG